MISMVIGLLSQDLTQPLYDALGRDDNYDTLCGALQLWCGHRNVRVLPRLWNQLKRDDHTSADRHFFYMYHWGKVAGPYFPEGETSSVAVAAGYDPQGVIDIGSASGDDQLAYDMELISAMYANLLD